MSDTREHYPVDLQDDLRWATQGEVCWGCSDPEAGSWVPVSFCPQALAADDAYGGVYLTDRGERIVEAFYAEAPLDDEEYPR